MSQHRVLFLSTSLSYPLDIFHGILSPFTAMPHTYRWPLNTAHTGVLHLSLRGVGVCLPSGVSGGSFSHPHQLHHCPLGLLSAPFLPKQRARIECFSLFASWIKTFHCSHQALGCSLFRFAFTSDRPLPQQSDNGRVILFVHPRSVLKSEPDQIQDAQCVPPLGSVHSPYTKTEISSLSVLHRAPVSVCNGFMQSLWASCSHMSSVAAGPFPLACLLGDLRSSVTWESWL